MQKFVWISPPTSERLMYHLAFGTFVIIILKDNFFNPITEIGPDTMHKGHKSPLDYMKCLISGII